MQQFVTSSGPRRPRFGRIRAALLLGGLAAAASGGIGACASTPDAKSGETCVGGVIKDGVCEGKCKPELCLEGNTCVDNRCVLQCDSHLDCYQGIQDCARAIEDDTKAEIFV